MKITSCFLILTLFAYLDFVESSRRRENDWIPSSPKNNEVLTSHEISSLLNHLDSLEHLHDGDFGHHSSMPQTSAENINQDHQNIQRAHNLSSSFECLSSGDPMHGVPHGRNSYAPARSLPPARSHSPSSSNRSSPPAEPHLRSRSRSPPPTRSSIRVLGYEIEALKSIRLIRKRNSTRRFEIIRYTFPRDKPIYLRGKNNALIPIPTEEQMVLSTSNGDIYAVLGRNNTLLRAIHTVTYDSEYQIQKRVKINMYSGAIQDMTPEEMEDSPIGGSKPLSKNFFIVKANDIPPGD